MLHSRSLSFDSRFQSSFRVKQKSKIANLKSKILLCSMILVLLLASSAVASPADSATEKTSWLGFLAKGGLTMIPIALCSIGLIAIVAAKFSIIRLMRFGINSFAEALTEDVSSGRIDQAIETCEEVDNPITRPLMRGLKVYKTEPSRTGDALREAMLDEMPGLESYIGWLGIIAGVAPLLGLFGTVIGIIQSFIELAAGGAVTDPSSFTLLADGIYKALITTAAGLFVGIPALVMYEYFRMKIADLVRDMDRVSVSLLNALGTGLGG
jgi:biopolymer transport protein ExbB